MRRFSNLSVLVVFVMMLGAGGGVEDKDHSPQSMEQAIDAIVADHVPANGPGCMMAVIKDGQFAYKKGFGLADVGGKVPITDETAFNAAGLSRHFTAATAAWLINNGAIYMDDDIRVYIPEMPKVDPPIRLENLIYHTSGIPDYIEVMEKAGLTDANDDLEIVELLAEQDLEFKAGEKFSPNRSNYFLLAFVIQRVPSMSLAEWAQKVVFDPLQMNRTVFSDHPEKTAANKAIGYANAENEAGFEKTIARNAAIAGDTGLHTTIGDLLKWEKTLSKGEFLGPKYHQLINTTGRLSDGSPVNYAFGMDVRTRAGPRTLSASGKTEGFSAAMLRVSEKRLTIICLSNYEDMDTARVVDEVTDVCLGAMKKTQAPQADNFAPIFDGKTFAGWEGNLDIFRIEDGAIVGGTLKDRIARNEFLCTKKEYGDFELRLKVKLLGDLSSANAGIQIRSRRIGDHHEMIGYQADMGQHYWGCLYDESRRRKVLAGPDRAQLAKVLKPGEWNDYMIKCQGRRIQLWINGFQTVDYTEEDESIEQKGVIGLQIHSGKPSEALYKDIAVKEL